MEGIHRLSRRRVTASPRRAAGDSALFEMHCQVSMSEERSGSELSDTLSEAVGAGIRLSKTY
jgi:hypothetical protein